MGSNGVDPRLDRTVAAALAFSLVTKLVFAAAAADLVPRNDAHVYVALARALAENGVYDEIFRPPLYPAFLAVVFWLGGGLFAARVVQALIATASVWLVARIAGRSFGRRAAGLAAWIFAVDPVLLGFSHLLWSETLFVFLLLAALALWLSGEQPGPRWIVAGVLLGFAALARPVLLTLVPLLALGVIGSADAASRRRTAVWACAVFVVMAATVAPWTARNAVRTGAFVAIDTNGPFNFLVGTESAAAFVDKDDHWSLHWGLLDREAYVRVARRDPARAQREGTARALANIANDPSGYAAKSLWEARHLWTLDSFPLRHLRNRWYGDAPQIGIGITTLACAGFTLFLYALGLLGVAAQPRSALRDVSILTLLHATLLFGATYALSRYAVPMRPFLALAAGWALAERASFRRRLVGSERTALRCAVVLCLMLALASSLWTDLPLLADMLATGGGGYRFSLLTP